MGKRLLTVVIGLALMAGPALAEHIQLQPGADDVNVFMEETTLDRTTLTFEVGGFEREMVQINGETYFRIHVDGEGNSLVEGDPDLPHLARSIVIPDDARMEIRVLASEYVDLPNTPIVPSKGNLLRNVNPELVAYTFGEPYDQRAYYPASLVNLRTPYILRDYRGIVVDATPFQYDPSTQTLRVYTSLTIEVYSVGAGETNVLQTSRRSRVTQPDFELIYQERFINFEEAFAGEKYTPVSEYGDILVICYDAWMPDMQPYVDWKLQKGIPTVMVSKTTAGATATAIHNYIQDYYDTTDVAFVLLVGHNAQIPTLTSGGGGADPMYALVAGSDGYPDLLLGRFSAENLTELGTQIDRTITYERDHPGSGWYHRGTGIGSAEGPGGHNGGEYDCVDHLHYIRDSLMMIGTYTEVDEICDPGASSSQVSAAVNDGRSIINYTGHGSTTAWSTTGFSNSNVNALVNDNMLPFIISVACVNGNFTSSTCFGEAWLRASNGGTPTGAIGMYASSINQSWAPPMDAQDEVVHLLVREMKSTYGGLCFNGSCKMIDINGSGGESMYNTWHIFGDPSVQVRTDDPAPMIVSHAGACFFNLSEYEVTVDGREGALCALYADGVLYGSAYTDAYGEAVIPISQMLPIGDPITLTVTDYNAETYIDEVVVTTDLTVLHTPLSDTKDTLNDYQVDATVYSDTALFLDSVFIEYDAGYGYNQVAMAWTSGDELSDNFTGYIPAQPAGTTVDYFLWAKNAAGFVDTTDVFSFFVIDYGVVVAPEYNSTMAPVDDTIWYSLTVTNDGVLADSYSLAVYNAVWETSLWDAAATTEISATTTLLGDETFDFLVRVIVPESWEDEYDSAVVEVVSTADGDYATSAICLSISAGEPWAIPFTDNFPTATIEPTKWEDGSTTADDEGLAEPSEPYSANLDGDPTGADTLCTEQINLRDETNVLVRYYYEQTGGGDSPESGDNLYVEYLDSLGGWNLLAQHDGADADMTEYEEVEMALPGDAMHAGFRVRWRNTATSGDYDDWFVDDVFVGHPSDYEVILTPYSQSTYGPAGGQAAYTVLVVNRGLYDDIYDLSVSGNDWSVTFYDETGTNPTGTTALIAGGDTGQFVVKVDIPADEPPHGSDIATLTATSQGDDAMFSTAIVETFSNGPAISFPMFDPFNEATLSLDQWFSSTGVECDGMAMEMPSTPYAARFDGGSDIATSRAIDMAGISGAMFSFYYECGANEDAPEAGDMLVFEYMNDLGEWTALYSLEGDGEAMYEFAYVNMTLPEDASHAGFQLRVMSDGGSAGTDDWWIDDLRIDYPPQLAVSPALIEETVSPEDSLGCDLVIMNEGLGGLNYSLNVLQLAGRGDVATQIAALDHEPAQRDYSEEFLASLSSEKGVDQPGIGQPVTRGYGGPDDYGYVWIDSDAGMGEEFDYNWIDVSATGTDIIDQLTDDSYAGPFDIGFEFLYYGEAYTEFYVGSNGIIGFSAADMDSRIKQTIPTADTPNNIVALMWDDLDPEDEDNLNAHLYVDNDGERCVIQLVDYPEYRAEAGDVITAEIILYNTGYIKLQYHTCAEGFDTQSGAVGIENASGTDGLEVCFAADYVHDGLAVTIVKPFEWLGIDQYSGSLASGEADTIHCMLTSGTLDTGLYNGAVIVNSNDPDPEKNPLTVPVAMTVGEGVTWLCADIDGDGVAADIADLVYLVGFMFSEGPAPPLMPPCDMDGSTGDPDIADLVYLVDYMFNEGPDPHCGL